MNSNDTYHHPIRLYAHRGSNQVFPENTLPAFDHALKEQATHLEMDLHCTKDMEIVVIHDPDGKRVANVNQIIATSKLKEIQSWELIHSKLSKKNTKEQNSFFIPSFSEVLDTFPTAHINADIKINNPKAIQKIVELLEHRRDDRRVLLTSFNPRVLHQLWHIPYKGETGISRTSVLQALLYPRFFWKLATIPGSALQIPPTWNQIRLDRPYIISRLHELGKRVDYWTINEPKEAIRLLTLGADGIFSDNISKIKEAVFRFANKTGRQLDNQS